MRDRVDNDFYVRLFVGGACGSRRCRQQQTETEADGAASHFALSFLDQSRWSVLDFHAEAKSLLSQHFFDLV